MKNKHDNFNRLASRKFDIHLTTNEYPVTRHEMA